MDGQTILSQSPNDDPSVTSSPECFSPAEEKAFRELCAKHKRIRRAQKAQKAFMERADASMNALLERWKEQGMISDTVVTSEKKSGHWEEILAAYGIDNDDEEKLNQLKLFLIREKAIRSFRDRIETSHADSDEERRSLQRSPEIPLA